MINYTNAYLSAVFDDEVIKYLENKNRGGGNNEIGTIYENAFAVYSIAILAKSIIEKERHINIYSQVKSVVDDLIIEIDGSNKVRHYQLKNKTKVSWGVNLKSISDDFDKQNVLNESLDNTSKIGLVVRTKKLKDSLNNSMPDNIKPFSNVRYFPYSRKLVNVVNELSRFRNAITYLTAFENPEPDKIECVATLILASWCNRADEISVRKLLENSQKSNPSFIRSLISCPDIDSDVSSILDKVKDFSYKISKGFFHWNYGVTDSGTLPYSMCDERFNKFQEIIKKNNPTIFTELEVYL